MTPPRLAVVTYWWGAKYGPEYVQRLAHQVARRLAVPHRFYVITDQPAPDGVEALELLGPLWHYPGCYRRLYLLSRAAGERFESMGFARVLHLDLDTLILGDLSPIIADAMASEFAIWRAPSIGRHGYVFNPSAMLFRPGALADWYRRFTRDPEGMTRLRQAAGWIGSDQGIISLACSTDQRRDSWRFWDERDGFYSMRDHVKGSDTRSRRSVLDRPPPDCVLLGWYGSHRIEDYEGEDWVREALA